MAYARTVEKTLALTLIAAVALTGLPAAASPVPAGLSGRVVRSASGAPATGAIVKVSLRPDGRVFQSGKADDSGNYALASIPAGQYDVAVEADGGLYVVGGSVALQPGEKRTMSLSVLAEADEPPAPPEPPAPSEPTPAPTAEAPKKAKTGFFHSVWGGTILVLGSAAVIGAVVASSDNDEPASASPSN